MTPHYPLRNKPGHTLNKLQKMDCRLDDMLDQIKQLIHHSKATRFSLVKNEFVHLYNEGLALSYSLKLYLLEFESEKRATTNHAIRESTAYVQKKSIELVILYRTFCKKVKAKQNNQLIGLPLPQSLKNVG